MKLKRCLAIALAFVIVFSFEFSAFAAETDNLPNIMILATGGTIAGTGETSTTTVGYTAAKVCWLH